MSGSDQLTEYIRTNRERFTREAIDATLREAGHDEARIAHAWAVVEGRAPAAEPASDGLATFLAIVGVVFAALAYGVAVVLGAFGALIATGSGPGAIVVLLVYTVAMAIAGFLTGRFLWRARKRASSPAIAVLAVAAVSTAVWFLFSGACQVALSDTRFL